jgi:CRP-like cAMP-binding protein
MSGVDVLRDLSPEEIDTWRAHWGTQTYAPGQRIVDADTSQPELVFLILEGAVRLVQHRNRRDTIDVLGRGQLFGVSAVFGPTSTALDVEALSNVVATGLEGRRFLRALASRPQLATNLVEQLGTNLLQFDAPGPPPVYHVARKRLAQTLVRLGVAAGDQLPDGWYRLPPCVSRATLAVQVDCTRETIARMLADLEEIGAIRRQRREIMLDLDRLHRVIAGRELE